MHIDQLALQLDDTRKLVRLWETLPPDSREVVARVYARLCVRAAKVRPPVAQEKGKSEPCKQSR